MYQNNYNIYHYTDNPVSWSDMSSKVHKYAPGMNMRDGMIYLMFDGMIFLLLSWYLDKIYPGEYGVPQNIFFVCSVS